MRLKWDNKGIKTPLARARGLGSAKDGTTHWFHQRLTAVANLALMLWLLWSFVSLQGFDYETVSAWLAMPVNAVLMILALLSVFYHAALGTQVIAEDYIHCEGMKIAALIALKLGFVAAAVVCIFSILKIVFSA